MSDTEYGAALKLGKKQYQDAVAKGEYPYLPVLDDVLSYTDIVSTVSLGTMDIPLAKLVGTKTAERSNSFANNFMPLLPERSEFGIKWLNLYNHQVEDGIQDPIVAYEFMNRFYVQEGNKRVSVMKYLGAYSIPGTVTRLIPKRTDDLENRLYYEFLDFYKVSSNCDVWFSKEGRYKELLKLMGMKPDQVWEEGKLLRVKGFSCQIIGELEQKGQSGMGMDKDDVVIIPLNTFQRRISGNVRIPLITVAVEPGSDIERVKESSRLLLRERRSLSSSEMDNFNILDTSELIETISKTTQVLTMLLGAVAAVSLLVGGIGIMNIMLVSVTERTKEIGVRLAIGATEREVLLQFLVESIMLACFGGLLGVILAFGASVLLTHFMGVPFIFSPGINVLAFCFAAFIGIIFGYFPARRAAQLDPIEAVRHE